MTAAPQTPAEHHRQPAANPQRRNRLAITAASFGVFALFLTIHSLSYRPGADIATSYAIGRFGAPLPFAMVALVCGIPALLRIRRPADWDGRTWDGKEPATVAVVAACLVTVVVVVRVALLVTSR